MNSVITILGCGDSAWCSQNWGRVGACDPDRPKNACTRPSLLVQNRNEYCCGWYRPDFSWTINPWKILDLNGVLYTHGHSDHVNGMDELRSFHRRQKKTFCQFSGCSNQGRIICAIWLYFEQKSSYYPAVAEPHVMEDWFFGFPHHFRRYKFLHFTRSWRWSTFIGVSVWSKLAIRQTWLIWIKKQSRR